MNQWDQRIRSHRIWELLNTIGPSIDKALERPELPPEAVDSLERLRTVLAFCGKRLAGIDPSLVLPASIENIAGALASEKSRIDTFVSNGDGAQLQAANGDADTALTHLATVLAVLSPDELSGLSEAAASYRASLERQLSAAAEVQQKLTERIQANEQLIARLETTLTTEQQRLANLINDFQSQFSAAQDKRGSDFAAAQNEQLTKFSSAFAELQTQFSGAQNARETTFSEFQRASTDKLATLISDANTQLANHNQHYLDTLTATTKSYGEQLGHLQNDYSDKASGILASIEKNKKDVESLVGVIGNLGVTSGYQKTANAAKWAMYFWQAVTSFALIGLIAVAIFTAFPALGGNLFGTDANHQMSANASTHAEKSTDTIRGSQVSSAIAASESDFYHGLATRIFLSLTFGVFAAYAGRQASHFMNIERRNRRLALELEALGPFIEPLGQEERSKFRVQVGERSFGVPDGNNEAPKGPDPTSGADIFKSKEFWDFFVSMYKEAKAKLPG